MSLMPRKVRPNANEATGKVRRGPNKKAQLKARTKTMNRDEVRQHTVHRQGHPK